MDDKPRLILCPYCGNTQDQPQDRCRACGGFFDPLSLKVTQQHMGPWFIRDRSQPFRPGCSYEVLLRQIRKGRIKPTTIIRGPTTRQFWSVARNVAGVAHLLGYCHQCGAHVEAEADACGECGEVFFAPRFRDQLGLAPVDRDLTEETRLDDSGPYTAVATAGSAVQQAAGGGYGGAPTTDRPVGSSILAGLRTEDATADLDADDSGAGIDTPDAMTWMTSDSAEPDTLQTAGQPTATLPTRRAASWTWALIAINLLLFAVAIAALILLLREPATVPTDGLGDSPTLRGPTESSTAGLTPTQSTPPAGPSDAAASGPTPTLSPSQESESPTATESSGSSPAPAEPPTPSPTPTESPAPSPVTEQNAAPQAEPEPQPAPAAAPATPSPAESSAQPTESPAEPQDTGEPSNIFDFGPIEEQLAEDEEESSTDAAEPPAAPEQVVARYQQALQLESEGKLEAALEQLTRLRDETPSEERPESLGDAIARVQQKINRAELERFFE